MARASDSMRFTQLIRVRFPVRYTTSCTLSTTVTSVTIILSLCSFCDIHSARPKKLPELTVEAAVVVVPAVNAVAD